MNRRRGAQWCLSMHPPAGDRSASAYVTSSFRSMWGFRVFNLILQLVKRTSLFVVSRRLKARSRTFGLPFHVGHSVRPWECIAAKTPLTSQAGTLTVRSILGRPR